MFRNRQRPVWSDADLADIYAGPHDHRVLGDGHTARVNRSIAIGRALWPNPTFVCDLSAGNGAIALGLEAAHTTLGDFARHPDPTWLCGRIEDLLDEIDPVDVFVCSETLEHLDDPDGVLVKIRARANALVCSVPISDRPGDDLNGEHYWAFDREGAEVMLRAAGWEPVFFEEVVAAPGSVNPTYRCGLFGCLPLSDHAERPEPSWTHLDPVTGQDWRTP